MRVIGLFTLVVLIVAGQSFVTTANQKNLCSDQWTGTITYRVTRKKKGTAENKLTFSYWSEDEFYESNAELDGSRNADGALTANVKATAYENKEWDSRGKGVCYRETDNSQAVSGAAYDNTTAFSITHNTRTNEHSVLAPTLMVYGTGQHVVSSRVKGTCNNPYNKDFNQVDKIERYQLTDNAPVLIGKGVIDPAKPNEFSGTDTAEHDTKHGHKTVTIKWNLRRCPGK